MVTASRTIQEEDDERRDAAARWYRIEELVEQHPLHRAARAAGRQADEALAMEIVEQVLAGVAAGPQATPDQEDADDFLDEAVTVESNDRWSAAPGQSYLLERMLDCLPSTHVRVVAVPTDPEAQT